MVICVRTTLGKGMSEDWSTLVWPSSRTSEAVTALAHATGLQATGKYATKTFDFSEIDPRIESIADALGLEAEPVETRYDNVETLLTQAKGTILGVMVAGEPSLLLVIKGGRRRLMLLTPDFRCRRVKTFAVRDLLRAPLEETMSPMLDQLLAALPSTHHADVQRAIMAAHLAGMGISVGWLLRLSPSSSFLSQLFHSDLCGRALWAVGAYTLAYGLWICVWLLIGAAALEGRYDIGWWQVWVLLLVSIVGLQALSGWWQTQFLTGAAALLKRRLFYGALQLNQDQVRREGAGQLLGQVFEAEAIESLALSGGLSAALALIELTVCLFVLAYGPSGTIHIVLLLFWLGLAAFLTYRYVGCRRAWTISRLGLTHYLIEQMLGHRTRLAQQSMVQWHKGEDEALAHYNEMSKKMDQWAVAVMTLTPRGWLIVGVVALGPALLSDSSTITLAVGLGGCLLAYAALQKCTHGVLQLAAATIAWDQIAPVFRAGRRTFLPAVLPHVGTPSNTVLVMQDVVFRYRTQGQALLRGIDLQISRGDRILLEGQSGGGKSTLANLITGLRIAESGLILLNGFDRQTLRDDWRQQAINVPQFHENHILSESLAFNLLMGRTWPPTTADVEEAKVLCRRLGLGELLERMPSGLWQIIGESGWRLSHGERSRVYLARALLQHATLMVFDESFAALDPENLERAVECVIERAPSLIVIAHP